MATSKDKSVRNPQAAVATALRAVEANNQDPNVLDTLALATSYFEAGQFDKAVEAERSALRLSPDKASYKQALEKYLSAAGKH